MNLTPETDILAALSKASFIKRQIPIEYRLMFATLFRKVSNVCNTFAV